MMRPLWLGILVVSVVGAGAARGEVMDASRNGFTSKNTVAIAAPPGEAFRALIQDVADWWDPAHTFSRNAGNLSIDAKVGGCFCEKLGERGWVRHLDVVFVDPGNLLRMRGGLGPLQELGATGSLTWAFAGTGDTTELTLTYQVGGYYPDGLDKLAGSVDAVLGEQLERLKSYIEKGSP